MKYQRTHHPDPLCLVTLDVCLPARLNVYHPVSSSLSLLDTANHPCPSFGKSTDRAHRGRCLRIYHRFIGCLQVDIFVRTYLEVGGNGHIEMGLKYLRNNHYSATAATRPPADQCQVGHLLPNF